MAREKSPTPTRAMGQPSKPYRGWWSARPWGLQGCGSAGPHSRHPAATHGAAGGTSGALIGSRLCLLPKLHAH